MSFHLLKRCVLFLLVWCIAANNGSYAQPQKKIIDNTDRILRFHSDIHIGKDGTIRVTENITVFNGNGFGTAHPLYEIISNNDDIQRGIVRDFPTKYKDGKGFWHRTGFSVKEITKNGEKEPYTSENLDNGERILIGRSDVLLTPGNYIYQLSYTTNNQLIFHPDKDEFYWNVNGNGWVFTADTVSCTLHFPEGSAIREYACYTGEYGARQTDCNAQLSDSSSISFSASRVLNAREGLTVAASIQKGILAEPGKVSGVWSFLRANYVLPLLVFFVLFVFGFYYWIWNRKGRDPRKGTIYPQFSPPAELTPSDIGYILEQEYGSHLFTAALIDCAVKKYLTIGVEKEGLIMKSNVYQFSRPTGTETIPSTNTVYGFDVKDLYGEKAKKGTYNSKLRSCYTALSSTLSERFLIRKGKPNKWYGLFALNRGYVQLGGVVILIVLFLAIRFLILNPSAILLMISVVLMLAMVIIHFVFARIMSAYSQKGRTIADHILGFRMYLETAEQKVYEKLTPPEKTLELFEKYLPYAIALKVENAWASKFEEVMQKAIDEGYTPTYYSMTGGNFRSYSMSDISRSISSGLSSTVSSASTPPSSSSGGSGGGGSSGGGGGGGGGGGW